MKPTRTMLGAGVLYAFAAGYDLRDTDPPQIRFDVGQNIFETAKKSGAPRYSTGNVAGLVTYELVDLPPDITAHYQRPGYEIRALPLFAFTLYADEAHNNGLAVQTATLQFSTDSTRTHKSAQLFVEALISQFSNGKWRRHISSYCPAVTGRSAFLNEAGEPEQIENCPLDPHHSLTAEDWARLMRTTQNYAWLGDGVLAILAIRYSDDIRGITYSIDLDFHDWPLKQRRDAANLARDLAEGDAQGWKSTETENKNMLAISARVRILEENAIKRGDSVLPRTRAGGA